MTSAGIGCRWLPVWLPELAIFDLFMTLNRGAHAHLWRGEAPDTSLASRPHLAPICCSALVALDVETLAVYGHDQSLVS
jgi:hypothetical protein